MGGAADADFACYGLIVTGKMQTIEGSNSASNEVRFPRGEGL